MENNKNTLKVQGYIRDDTRKIPYLGEANTISKEKWNALAAELATKHFIQDHNGQQPESAEQALAYEKQKYEGMKRIPPKERPEISIRRGDAEIIYFQ